VEIEYRRADGTIAGDRVRLIDFERPERNDFVAVNQFTVIEGQHNRRPDIVVFVNGLPLAVIELKNAADEEATVWTAFNQLQTYKQQIASLFAFNEALVISDGLTARIGSLTADKERFMPWRTIEGEDLAPATMLELEVLTQGLFDKSRFLAFLRSFIVFEEEKSGQVTKKIAGYHQFHAVGRAVATTVAASRPGGDHRCGVVWHTQGSGKSLTMAFYAGSVILHPEMENPTLVVLTDRNDQLFGTFSRCHELLRQKPVQANDRAQLREYLKVASGGVVFTTIQKFTPEQKGDSYPLLSDRRNIVVIADEAHRSQYDFIDGYARHLRDSLPNASFIGFTGTPIEATDRNTRAVFGDYISIYDIQRAVEDKATVPIYYESRLAKPVRSGSLCGRRCLMLLLTCLFENPMSRRMVAEYARLHLLMPTTAGAGCFPPAIAPRAWQSLPHALAQLGRCRYLAQQREQRIHLDQLADCHHLPLHVVEQLLVGNLLRLTCLVRRQVGAHDLQRVVHQQAERHLKQYRLRHRADQVPQREHVGDLVEN